MACPHQSKITKKAGIYLLATKNSKGIPHLAMYMSEIGTQKWVCNHVGSCQKHKYQKLQWLFTSPEYLNFFCRSKSWVQDESKSLQAGNKVH
jgi:hypothetical protein